MTPKMPFAIAINLLFCLTCPSVSGSVWQEEDDAGQLLNTAQVTTELETLVAIRGDLTGVDDIDLYAIWISNPMSFSATTVNPNTELIDTDLFLFRGDGTGVAANGDTDLFETNATIPVGSVVIGSGLHYLGVATFGDTPNSEFGSIFPETGLFTNPGEVVGPTGPGGAAALMQWQVDQFSEPMSGYEIALTGVGSAVVPEPSSLMIFLLLVVTAFCLGGVGRLRGALRKKIVVRTVHAIQS